MKTYIVPCLCWLLCAFAPLATAQEVPLGSPEGNVPVILSPTAPRCLELAARDVAEDFRRANGAATTVGSALEGLRGTVLMAAVADDHEFLETLAAPVREEAARLQGQWESYTIMPVENPVPGLSAALVVLGSDAHGAMYGLYEVSESALGADPLQYWSDIPPREANPVWRDGLVRQGPPTFKYRGLFINDEDLLLAWKGDQPDQTIEPEVYTGIFETICRLRGNMIAPGMFAHYMDPESRQLAHDRGLYYTASHLEVLLSNPQNYWEPWSQEHFGEVLPYSYTRHADKLRQFWRDAINRNKQYRNIWPVGLRGITDWAFWQSDPDAPDSMAARARVVGNALSDQVRLLHEEVGPDAVAALHLRDEVLELLETGELNLPEEVILVWDDWAKVGRIRALPDPDTARHSGPHGLYYHVTASQSQWIQAVPPAVVREEFLRADNVGTTEFVLINVGDLREHIMPAHAALDMAYDLDAWRAPESAQAWLEQWCGERFGQEVASQTAGYYNELFRLENLCRSTSIVEAVAPYATTLDLYNLWPDLSAIDLAERTGPAVALATMAELIQFDNLPDRYWPVSGELLTKLDPLWGELWQSATTSVLEVGRPARPFYARNLLLQITTGRQINEWALGMIKGFEACGQRDFVEAAEIFMEPQGRMKRIAMERDLMSPDKWVNWYRGEAYHVWDRSLWTLKPEQHSEDAFRLSTLAAEAARGGREVLVVATVPDELLVVPMKGLERSVLCETSAPANPCYLAGWIFDNTDGPEAVLKVAGQEMVLPRSTPAGSMFCIELPSDALPKGEGTLGFGFADRPSEGDGYRLDRLRLVLPVE